MIVSAISKRQVDQRKHSFLEKKISIKRKMDSLWTPRNIALLYGSCYKTVEDNTKGMNIANFINIYTNVYI